MDGATFFIATSFFYICLFPSSFVLLKKKRVPLNTLYLPGFFLSNPSSNPKLQKCSYTPPISNTHLSIFGSMSIFLTSSKNTFPNTSYICLIFLICIHRRYVRSGLEIAWIFLLTSHFFSGPERSFEPGFNQRLGQISNLFFKLLFKKYLAIHILNSIQYIDDFANV